MLSGPAVGLPAVCLPVSCSDNSDGRETPQCSRMVAGAGDCYQIPFDFSHLQVAPMLSPQQTQGPLFHHSSCHEYLSAYRLWWAVVAACSVWFLWSTSHCLLRLLLWCQFARSLHVVLLPVGDGACLPGQQAQAPPDGWPSVPVAVSVCRA